MLSPCGSKAQTLESGFHCSDSAVGSPGERRPKWRQPPASAATAAPAIDHGRHESDESRIQRFAGFRA